MEVKKVKDIMLPLDEYAIVSENATLYDAFKALKDSQDKLDPGRQPHRAVLVVNKKNKVLGKVGHLAFLKALEPKYDQLGDLHVL